MFLAVLAGCVEEDEADSNADANEALKDGYDGTRFLLLFVSVSVFFQVCQILPSSQVVSFSYQVLILYPFAS